MPSLNFGDAPPWLQWVIAALAVLAFIAACLRAIPPAWRFITRFVYTVNELAELPTELKELRQFRTETASTLKTQNSTLEGQNQKIDVVMHELQWNDESSVKDAVHRIELGVRGLDTQVAELKEADAEIRSQIQPKNQGDTK